MMHLRAIMLCLLTGLMSLTSVSAAMARGHMAADGVICTTGTYTVVLAADGLPLFDRGGAPIEAQDVPCLECIFGKIAHLPATGETSLASLASSTLIPFPPSVLSPRLWRMGGQGRSPPRAA